MPAPGAGLGAFLVGGGQQQAQQALSSIELANMMEQQRLGIGQQLMEYLTRIQQDPFSIVPALQAYGQVGGGTLAPAAALAASGGAGMPSPFGELQSRLMRVLSEQAGATPINPQTGQPLTPGEMDYLRLIGQRELVQRGAEPAAAMMELARAEPQRQSVRQSLYQLPTGGQGIFVPVPPKPKRGKSTRGGAPFAATRRFASRRS